jgi:hypothetical protein
MRELIAWIIIVGGVFWVDNKSLIFPDEFYCFVGAGQAMVIPTMRSARDETTTI